MSTYLTFPNIQQSSFPIAISYENISLKSRKENGDYKLRKKFTNARKTFTLKWNAMSSEDYQTLESFYINDCQTNVKKFLWKYPSIKANIRTRYDIFNNHIFVCRFYSFSAKASEHNSYIVEVVLNEIEDSNSVIKLVPILSLGEWVKNGEIYSAVITYDGDGQLSAELINTDIDTDISVSINDQLQLITSNPDGVSFNGVINASEGVYYVATSLDFEFAEGIPLVIRSGACYTYFNVLERQSSDYNPGKGIVVNNYNNIYYLLWDGWIHGNLGLLSSANVSENGDLYLIYYHYLDSNNVFASFYKNQELFNSIDLSPYHNIVTQAQDLLPIEGLNENHKYVYLSSNVEVYTIWSFIEDENDWAIIFLVKARARYSNERARQIGRGKSNGKPDFGPVIGNVSVWDVYQEFLANSCIEVFYLLTPNNVVELFRWYWYHGYFKPLTWYEYTGGDDIESHWNPSNWFYRDWVADDTHSDTRSFANISSIPSGTKVPLPDNFYYIVNKHSPVNNNDSLFADGLVNDHDLYSIYRTVVTISLFSPDDELVFNGEISMFFHISAIKIDESKYLVNFLNPIERDYYSLNSIYDVYSELKQAHPNLISEGLYICENGKVKEKLLNLCLNQRLRVMNNIKGWQNRITKKLSN